MGMAEERELITVEEGWIYGAVPKKPVEFPDVIGLLEATGVPTNLDGQLPHTEEWYAGAKDRIKQREKETRALYDQVGALRQEWADIVLNELALWSERVVQMRSEPGAYGKLQTQLARINHERPADVIRIQQLRDSLVESERVKEETEKQLVVVGDNIDRLQVEVKEKEAAEKVLHEAKMAFLREEKLRRKRNERLLRRAQAILAEKEPPPDSSDSDDVSPVSKKSGGTGESSPVSSAAFHFRPGSGVRSFGLLEEPSPRTPKRGGIARELPPIVDPPPPPQLPSPGLPKAPLR